jgi:hypothetical protein
VQATKTEDYECGVRVLRPPGKKHHYQDNENDTADPDSAIGSESVITAAAAKQQKQDQDQ